MQEYNTRKLFERGVKSILHDKHAISVAPPDLYAQRFKSFLRQQVRVIFWGFVWCQCRPRGCLGPAKAVFPLSAGAL